MDDKYFEYITVSHLDSIEYFSKNTPALFSVRIPEILLNQEKYKYKLGLHSVQYPQRLLRKGNLEPGSISIFCDLVREQLEYSHRSNLLRRFASGFKVGTLKSNKLISHEFDNIIYLPILERPSINDIKFTVLQNDSQPLQWNINSQKGEDKARLVLILHLIRELKYG